MNNLSTINFFISNTKNNTLIQKQTNEAYPQSFCG